MEMEEDSDSDGDMMELAGERTLLMASTKRKLIEELEECVTHPDENIWQNHQTKGKKQKWGPELLVERPRRNTGDNRTMIQKATDLKSFKNLEVPTRGAGNSFAALELGYLSCIADKVDISLGVKCPYCLSKY
jgi:hypothetical protein